MKNNFLVEQSEREIILNQHKNFKQILEEKKSNNRLIISEQVTGKPLLDKAVTVCRIAMGGAVKYDNKNGKYLIRKVANYDSPNASFITGDIIYLYDNFKGTSFSPDPKNPTKAGAIRKDGWGWSKCAESVYQDDLAGEIKNGWYTKTMLDDSQSKGKILIDFTQPNTWDEKPWGAIKLYKPRTGGQTYQETGKYAPDAQAWIDSYSGSGWEFRSKLTSNQLEPNGPYRCQIVPGSEKHFTQSNGIEMCITGAKLKEFNLTRTQDRTNTTVGETYDVKACQKSIKQYWAEYKRNKSAPENQAKIDVQTCIDQHWNDLGTGLFNRGDKYYHKILQMFTGERREPLEGKNAPDRTKTAWMLRRYNA
jgi:hypothetical protein